MAANPDSGGGARRPGALRVAFEAGPDGRTRLVERFAAHPLAVGRPIYGDPALPGLARVYVLTTGAGVLDGDRLEIAVRLGPGAQAWVGAVGATRVHPARGGGASLRAEIELGGGALLEWMPDPLIPFAGSRFVQATEVHLSPGALLLAADVLTAGREAAGERWAFARLAQSFVIRAAGSSRPLAAESLLLEPGRLAVDGPGAMAGHGALGSFRACGGAVAPARLAAVLREALSGHAGIVGGATVLPGGCGVLARVLGRTAEDVVRALHATWGAARQVCLGVPAPPLRRN